MFPKKQNLFRNLEDSPEMQNVLDGPLALRKWLRSRTRIKEIGAIAPDPALQLKGVLRMTRKTLDLNRELQFRVSLVRSGLGVDTTLNETNVEQFAYIPPLGGILATGFDRKEACSRRSTETEAARN